MSKANIFALLTLLNLRVYSTSAHELELKPLVDSKSTSSTKANHEESTEDRRQLSTEEKLMSNSIQEGIKPDQDSELPIGKRIHDIIASGRLSGRITNGFLRVDFGELLTPTLEIVLSHLDIDQAQGQDYDDAFVGLFRLMVRNLSAKTGAEGIMVFWESHPMYTVLDDDSKAEYFRRLYRNSDIEDLYNLLNSKNYVIVTFDPFAITFKVGSKIFYKTAPSEG